MKYRRGSSLDLAIDSRVMEVVMLLTIDLGCLGCVNDFCRNPVTLTLKINRSLSWDVCEGGGPHNHCLKTATTKKSTALSVKFSTQRK